MQLNLPKKYLSYSAWALWNKSKAQFREKYYLGKPSVTTPETIFGNKIGKMMEDPEEIKKCPVLSSITNYPIKEHGIEIFVGDVKVMGYLDQFHPELNAIVEMKTGHLSQDGTAPWSQLKVEKHKQLDWYSMMVEEKYGKVQDECELIWLETDWKEEIINYKGHKFSKGRQLYLTGKVETFKRNVYDWQRKKIKEDIIRTAFEISEDYTRWLECGDESSRIAFTQEEPPF